MRAEMMGQTFEGHGLFGYDTRQGAHVGSWVDNGGTWMAVSKGTCARTAGRGPSFSRATTRRGSPSPSRRSTPSWTTITAPR